MIMSLNSGAWDTTLTPAVVSCEHLVAIVSIGCWIR